MELLDDKMRVWLESAKFVKSISGIYVFYNRNKEPIFVGETENHAKKSCLRKTIIVRQMIIKDVCSHLIQYHFPCDVKM